MKEQAVRLSGVVYVKDPRDIQTIKELRATVKELRKDAASFARKIKPFENLEKATKALKDREKKLDRIASILHQRHRTIQRVRNMRVDSFIQGKHGFWYTQNDEMRSLKP